MGVFLDNTGLTKLVELIKGSLPTKATSSTIGLVKPDNSTITVDSDGVISSSGGGTTYTAGNGISIDANEVISKNVGMGIWDCMTNNNSSTTYNPYVTRTTSNTTWQEFISMLRAGKVVYVTGSPAWSSGYSNSLTAQTLYGDANANFIYKNFTGDYNAVYDGGGGVVYPRDGFIYYFDGVVLFRWQTGGQIIQHAYIGLPNEQTRRPLGQWLDMFNTSIKSLNTAVPAAPTTDGNYVLKCSVVSGTPTYSWVSET